MAVERKKRYPKSASEFLAVRNEEVSIILAELAESAGLVARSWHLAVNNVASNPERALENLVDAEIRLNHHMRLGLSDTLGIIRAAEGRLDRELPDDEEATWLLRAGGPVRLPLRSPQCPWI